jgi:lipopolysaccharide export system protein LptA
MSSRPAEAVRPLSLLFAGLAALACAGIADARTTDRTQPLDVESNSSDCSVTDDGPCTLIGDVHLVQGTLVVRAGRAVVHRTGGDIRRVVLTGAPVQLSQQLDDGSQINARAANVDYDMATDTVVFTGDAFIDQPGRGKIAGGRIAYNMKSGQVQGSGEGKQRVKMQFVPKGTGAAGSR